MTVGQGLGIEVTLNMVILMGCFLCLVIAGNYLWRITVLTRWISFAYDGGISSRRGIKQILLSAFPVLSYLYLPTEEVLDDSQLGMVCVEVATRLRSGESSAEAWRKSWQHRRPNDPELTFDDHGVPRLLQQLGGIVVASSEGRSRGERSRIKIRIARGKNSAVKRSSRTIAGACHYSSQLGSPLAGTLELIASGIDQSESAHEARDIASAGARTSVRIMTLLPILGIALSHVLGADPLTTFRDGGVGTWSFFIGITCLILGHLLFRYLIGRASRSTRVPVDPAILCDLAANGLASGASVPSVIEALGHSFADSSLVRCARELRLGVRWQRAWEDCHESYQSVARALEVAWVDGASPQILLERSAQHIRQRAMAQARIDAERLGVSVVVPVSALLLPAFVALAVIPAIVHFAELGFDAVIHNIAA